MYHVSSTFEDILHDYFDSPNILNRYFEEDDEMLILMMMTHINTTRRYFYVSSQHIDMDLHHQRLMLDGTFKNHYCMTSRAFEKLVNIVGPIIQVKNTIKSKNRTGIPHLQPSGKLCIAISYLVGGRYQDICTIAGIHQGGFYQLLYQVLDAINDSMNFHFPSTTSELEKVRIDFAKLSYCSIFS